MDDKTMKAKHRLLRSQEIEKQREETLNQLERVTALLETASTSYISTVNVQQSRNIDRLQVLTERKHELLTQLEELTISEIEEVNAIGDMIEGMQNTLHSRLLTMKYIGGKKLEAIADILGFSQSYIRKTHLNALKDFYACYLE